MIKAIIFGSTGMIGQGVLMECLANPMVESVLAINRNPVGKEHPKLTGIIHHDFFDLTAIIPELTGYNACFFCLGISSAGLKEPDYRRITYDLTLSVANTLVNLNKEMRFCYISGAGTDSTAKGSTMWARVKGMTENELLKLPFKGAYMFRPGFIQPMNGIRSKTALYNFIYLIFKPFYFLLKHFEGFVTNTSTLAKAMIIVAGKGSAQAIFESGEINEIVKKGA